MKAGAVCAGPCQFRVDVLGKSVKMARRKGERLRCRWATLRLRPNRLLVEGRGRTILCLIPSESVRDRLVIDAIYRYGLRRREATLIRVSDLAGDRIWISRLKGSVSGESRGPSRHTSTPSGGTCRLVRPLVRISS